MAINAGDWFHQATFGSTPVSASQARDFVRGHLVEHRLTHLVDAVVLVVSELATNAIVHAQTAFIVTLAIVDGTLLLTVRDGSVRPPTTSSARATGTSGRGLDIVANTSLDWGIDQDAGSKTVWASFALGEQQT